MLKGRCDKGTVIEGAVMKEHHGGAPGGELWWRNTVVEEHRGRGSLW